MRLVRSRSLLHGGLPLRPVVVSSSLSLLEGSSRLLRPLWQSPVSLLFRVSPLSGFCLCLPWLRSATGRLKAAPHAQLNPRITPDYPARLRTLPPLPHLETSLLPFTNLPTLRYLGQALPNCPSSGLHAPPEPLPLSLPQNFAPFVGFGRSCEQAWSRTRRRREWGASAFLCSL